MKCATTYAAAQRRSAVATKGAVYLEECIECHAYTGKAGPGDGSLYCDSCDRGPYCDECIEETTAGTLACCVCRGESRG